MLRLASATMMRAIRAVSVERGRDPRQFALLAFGGNGPLFAAGIAAELGIGRVIVPPMPGVFSAFGLLVADTEHHASAEPAHAAGRCRSGADRRGAGRADRRPVRAAGARWLSAGAAGFRRAALARYVGQSSEIEVPLPDADAAPSCPTARAVRRGA